MSKITTMVVIGSLMLVVIAALLFASGGMKVNVDLAVARKILATEAHADSPPEAVLVVQASNGCGQHGRVWRFTDNNRDCYFNGSGGIWCSN